MKVSYNWLSEYLDLNGLTHEYIEEKIATHISELEEYKKQVSATNLEVGFVKECVKHVNSDKLSVCQVELSSGLTQIVCGASNVKAGIKVIVAKPGAVLPKNFIIKEAKVRGEDSNGMICSLQELGIEDKYIEKEYKDGIYILGQDAVVGSCPLEYLHFNDHIINIELTSNRSDLLSVEGIAYDLGAALNKKVNLKDVVVTETINNDVSVKIDSKNCLKYVSRVLKGVKIAPSPNWLKQRLITSGIRPISNVVDVTNYVMLQVGQPLHAFNLNKLDNNIVVRQAFDNEEVVTLDEVSRKLSSDDLVITNGKEVVAIAGVMGCANSEIDDNTTDILLESAYFEPLSVRRTSTKLGLKSESSTRYERKVDINKLNKALDIAATMIASLTGAKVSNISFDDISNYQEKIVNISLSKINSVIGKNLSSNIVEDIFNRLQYTYTKNNDEFTITIPSRRTDLEENYQDIIEDIVRMYGYNNVEGVLPKSTGNVIFNIRQKVQRHLRMLLSHFGLNETISYSLLSDKVVHEFVLTKEQPVKLLMPLSEDKNVMRQSLLNGLIEVIKYNKARKVSDLALFELGKKYTLEKESNLLAIAMTGVYSKSLWQQQRQEVDFFVLKGIVEKIFAPFNHINLVFEKKEDLGENFHPKRSAIIKIHDTVVGLIAAIHPRFTKENGLDDTYVFEMNLSLVEKALMENNIRFASISKYPTINRDLAIVCQKDVTFDQIKNVIKENSKNILVNMELFDLYMGQNISEDEKSVAVTLTFQDKEKTLETNEVEEVVNEILKQLDKKFKARLR